MSEARSAECGVRRLEFPLTPALSRKGRGRLDPYSAFCTPNPAGFTLIEVLLALTILALVVTIVYMTFSTTSVNVERAEAARDETDLARALVSRLSSDIANAYCRTSQATTTFFLGKKEEAEEEGKRHRRDSLALTTLTNWRRPDTKESELWEVGYFFTERPDGSGSKLMRREKRELSKDVPPLEGGTEYELTDRVRELRLRYFVGGKWQDEYGGSRCNGLPSAVEIALTMEGERVYVTQVMVDRPVVN